MTQHSMPYTGWNAGPLKDNQDVSPVITEVSVLSGNTMIANCTIRKINTDLAGLGDIGEKNNVCVEFPEADIRLKQWAKWKHENCNLRELDYPSCSSYLKQPGGYGYQDVYGDPEAELVDRLVSQLHRKYSDIYAILMSRYYYGDSNREGARKNKLKIGKYQIYLKIGISWIDRGLFECS